LIEQGPVSRIGDPLAHGREGVGHRVEGRAPRCSSTRAPARWRQDSGLHGGGARWFCRCAPPRRSRTPASPSDPTAVERQLCFEDGIGAALKPRSRWRCRRLPHISWQCSRRSGRAPPVGTAGLLPDAQRAKVSSDRASSPVAR
jgi:hypothetical protein